MIIYRKYIDKCKSIRVINEKVAISRNRITERLESPLILFRGLSMIVNNPRDESRSSHEAGLVCDSAREKETRMA